MIDVTEYKTEEINAIVKILLALTYIRKCEKKEISHENIGVKDYEYLIEKYYYDILSIEKEFGKNSNLLTDISFEKIKKYFVNIRKKLIKTCSICNRSEWEFDKKTYWKDDNVCSDCKSGT